MDATFLTNFMRFVQSKTKAERSMAFDLEMTIHDRVNLDDDELNKPDFADVLQTAIDEAINTDDYVITNNLLTPEDAPKTNIHLHKLRMMVAIPLAGHGAIYIDQQIRQGVFPRDLVERITEFGHYVVENDKTDLSPAEYDALFQQ
ncbi:MAG: hypothetical protein AAF846_06640 [Chloroflexota bacterium]